MGALLGELLSEDSEGYGRRAQGTDTTRWGPLTWNSEIVLSVLRRRDISLYEISVRGTWKKGSFPTGPEGYEGKVLGMDIPSYGGSVGQPVVG